MFKKILEIISDESIDSLTYFMLDNIKISENDILSDESLKKVIQINIQKFQIQLLLFNASEIESINSYEIEYEILESNNEYTKLNLMA